MNVCEVPDLRKDVEHQYITEDSKTRVYVSVVRKFDEAEYAEYYARREKEKVRKRLAFTAKVMKYIVPTLISAIFYHSLSKILLMIRGSEELGSELIAVAIVWIWIFAVIKWTIGGDKN